MFPHLVAYRRRYIAEFVEENRPVSVQAVANHLHNARNNDGALSKSVSDDLLKCYETTSKDLQKLRKEGVVPFDAIVFPINRAG